MTSITEALRNHDEIAAKLRRHPNPPPSGGKEYPVVVVPPVKITPEDTRRRRKSDGCPYMGQGWNWGE